MRLRILLLLVVALIVGLPVNAQETISFDRLDVIFLVDQSGSMGGEEFGNEDGGIATDPLQLRFRAVNYALKTLGQYRLDILPDVPMRMAVVNFGDNAQIATGGWVDIAQTGDLATWEANRIELEQSLSADAFREANNPDNLGFTNFVTAFEAAENLFNQLPSDENALRTIILLTDGSPCVPAQFDCEADRDSQRDHMNRLQELADNAFPDSSYRIYVVALDASGGLWSQWQQDWEDITRTSERATRVETDNEVGKRFQDILAEVTSEISTGVIIEPLPGGRTVKQVPPYVSEIQLTLFKSNTQPGVLDINSPDGSDSYELVVEDADLPIETWHILNPIPGEWEFEVPVTTGFSAVLQYIPIDLNLELSADSFIVFSDVTLALDVTQADGSPIPAYPGYDVNVEVDITTPNDTNRPIPLAYRGGTQYSATFLPEVAGTYEIGVEVFSRLPDSRVFVIEQRNVAETFDVSTVDFALTTVPTDPILLGEMATIEATLLDGTGNELPFANQTVTGTFAQGSQLNVLEFVPIGEGRFQLEAALETDGDYMFTAEATVQRTGGDEVILGESQPVNISVVPSIPVGLVRILPEEDSLQQTVRTGTIPLAMNPFTVEFEVQLEESGESLLLDTVAQNPTWDVQIARDGEIMETEASVESMDTNGRYRLEFPALPTGDYELNIMTDPTTRGTYLFSNNDLSLSLSRVYGTYFIVFWSVAAVLATLLLAGVISFGVLKIKRSRHPAKGKLVVRKLDDKTPLITIQLTRYHSNYIEYSNKRLRTRTGVKKLIIRSNAALRKANERVDVTIIGDKNTQNARLRKGETVTIRLEGGLAGALSGGETERFEIAKDPETFGF